MKFKTQFNENYKPAKGEINTKPSLTQPDMSLSILELLTNHSRGIHSDIKIHEPQYFDSFIPQHDDITEQIEFYEELKANLAQAAKEAKEEKEAAIKKRKEEQEAKKHENGKQDSSFLPHRKQATTYASEAHAVENPSEPDSK